MARIIFFILIFLAAALMWIVLQDYDVPITAEFGDNILETSMARLSLLLLVFFVVVYTLLRIIFWLTNSPKRLMAKLKKENEENGYKNIMSGFSALAAGDVSRARKLSDKAEKALPAEPLVKLLQAQVATISGEKARAEELLKGLTEKEESRFLGYRGLIGQAIESNEPQKALLIADELLKENPKSAWLNSALIDLGFRNQDWDKLERYLKKAEANKSVNKDELRSKFAVFYHVKARIARNEKRAEDAIWLGERALKYDDEFLPAALFLSAQLVESEEYKKAKSLIEKHWKIHTHPALAKLYEDSIVGKGERNKLKQFRKLYELAPEDVESIMVYARALIAEGDKTKAKEIIQHGLSIRETRGLCLLMAQIDDRIAWQNRAETASEDKCWHCRITGARYPDWQLYSESGELNTIVWDFPPESARIAFGQNKYLLLS